MLWLMGSINDPKYISINWRVVVCLTGLLVRKVWNIAVLSIVANKGVHSVVGMELVPIRQCFCSLFIAIVSLCLSHIDMFGSF